MTALAETQAVTCLQVANNKHRIRQVSQYFKKSKVKVAVPCSSFVSILCGIFLLIKATEEEVAKSMKPKKTAAKAKAVPAPPLGETPVKDGKRCQKPTPPETTPEIPSTVTKGNCQKRLRAKVTDPNPESQVLALKEVGDLVLL